MKRCCLSFETVTRSIRHRYKKPGGVCLVLKLHDLLTWNSRFIRSNHISLGNSVICGKKKCATSKHFVLINSK